MPGILLGAAVLTAPPPVVVPSIWPGIAGMTWAGWDGSVFDLISGSEGVSMQRGMRGHDSPPEADRYTSISPALAGSRFRGFRDLEREVYWPLKVFSDAGSSAWLAVDRALWKTLHRDQTGTWSITDPNGNTRTLVCRFSSVAPDPAPVDPMLVGWRMYGITLVAEQPYWQGAPVTRSWDGASDVDFFNGAAKAPPYHVTSGSKIAAATITNPGDVPAYPIYTVTGPTTSVSVGYGGNVVSLGVIPAGQTRIVDTRPDRLTVVDQAGVDKWSELGAATEFDAPIPPGTAVTLSLALVGAGNVGVTLLPNYLRAFG